MNIWLIVFNQIIISNKAPKTYPQKLLKTLHTIKKNNKKKNQINKYLPI